MGVSRRDELRKLKLQLLHAHDMPTFLHADGSDSGGSGFNIRYLSFHLLFQGCTEQIVLRCGISQVKRFSVAIMSECCGIDNVCHHSGNALVAGL